MSGPGNPWRTITSPCTLPSIGSPAYFASAGFGSNVSTWLQPPPMKVPHERWGVSYNITARGGVEGAGGEGARRRRLDRRGLVSAPPFGGRRREANSIRELHLRLRSLRLLPDARGEARRFV